jgi:hypothetical protein
MNGACPKSISRFSKFKPNHGAHYVITILSDESALLALNSDAPVRELSWDEVSMPVTISMSFGPQSGG